jgi:RNA polymerase sigma factor (sigma-70 family)
VILTEPTDEQLIRQFADTGDDDAFALIVRRNIDWVYSMSLRLTHGDHAAADDIAQAVFILLARKSRLLGSNAVLRRWLFVSTRLCFRAVQRHEQRLRARERRSVALREVTQQSEFPDWDALSPSLDALVARLGAGDRDVILMRFYQGMSFARIGGALRISEDAARKRLARAVERLREMLARRGITSAAVALATLLAEQTTRAAPESVATGAASHGAAGGVSEYARLHAIARSAIALKRTTLLTRFAAAMLVLMLCATGVLLINRARPATSQTSVVQSIASSAQTATNPPSARGPAAPGRTIRALSRGAIGGAPSLVAPGDAVNLDFRSVSRGLPLDVVSVRITYSTNASPTAVKLQLPTGEILTVPMLSPNATAFEWYNPAVVEQRLLGQIPHAQLPQALRNELSTDGILNARLWIEGATSPGTFYQLAASVEAYDSPVPVPSEPHENPSKGTR